MHSQFTTRLLLAALLVNFSHRHMAHSTASAMEPAGSRDIQVKYTSPFPGLPPYGFFPLSVTITNSSRLDTTHTAILKSTTSRPASEGENSLSSSFFFNTAANSESLTNITVPLCTPSSNYWSLESTFTGFGILNPRGNSQMSTYYSYAKSTRYTLMSRALHTGSWQPISNHINTNTSRSEEFSGGLFLHNQAPTDWRAYIGVSAVWITTTELAGMTTEQRRTLYRGVAQGMTLQLFDESPDARPLLPQESREISKGKWFYGLGKIQLHTWDGKNIEPAEGATIWRAQTVSNPEIFSTASENTGWMLAENVRPIRLNILVFTIFILAFAIIIGPVNLFYFAGEGRRSRLFWTTPLISIIAAVALSVFVLLSDGLGGDGLRHITLIAYPADNAAHILQDQASRTGVLISQRFETDADIWLTPINSPQFRAFRPGNLERTGKIFNGDWFTSRTMQGHIATQFRPLRERIELVGTRSVTEGFKAPAVPVILSTFSVPLDYLLYIDDNGKKWQAENLVPGRSTTLKPYHRTRDIQPQAERPAYISTLLKDANNRKGWYYAYSAEAHPLAIPTLPDIKWKKTTAHLLGPISRP